MPHYIREELCTGCTVCYFKCPTNAISGDKKELHLIAPDRCIDCRTCGRWCPYYAIEDQDAEIVPYYKAKVVPKAYVVEESCTGCDICVVVCPFDAISLIPHDRDAYEHATAAPMSDNVALVDAKKCVGCQLCEDVCIKHAILVDYGDSDASSSYQRSMIFHGGFHGGSPQDTSNNFTRLL